ncbi:hypothetical protein CLV33_10387 [Jejuia pallidilutea]|uniref:Uncharacterized protein n=1 Tax=Jejuia pallidilutea TaxID=504487 RepID=A0A362XAT2_9FLAO|nr:hypothetical protein [Jejuia pallidilutea]PQV49456.1 hypothetical protein CLV33_10387 [Jejuia pallidilutea]
MKKIALSLLILLSVFFCKNDDDNEIDCSLIDIGPPNIYIELVDANGNNLIENETYIADNITVTFKGYIIENVVFKNVPSVENFIALSVSGSKGDNTFNIHLSENETDILTLNLSEREVICSVTFYTINETTYNGEIQTLKDFNGDYLITITK